VRSLCRYTQQVVVREWSPLLRQEYEFRAFVHQNKLTAITQYNQYCYYPRQVAERAHILATLTEYWEGSVRDKLVEFYENYVVDFAILEGGGVVVIELNPFDKFTGGGLFVWENTSDFKQLHEGLKVTKRAAASDGDGSVDDGDDSQGDSFEIELRLRESPPEGLANLLEAVLVDVC
jgi:hypothetical protein